MIVISRTGRLLRRLVRLSCRRPGATVALSLLLAVAGVGYTLQALTFKTKGDANLVADPEDKTFPAQVGIVRLAVPIAGTLAASVQAYWRLALTLIAAITFFSCAGAIVFRREAAGPRVPAPARLRRGARPIAVTIDADDAWNAHLTWLGTRRTEVA